VIKVVMGYDVAPGVTDEEYEAWLADVHTPDLMQNPHLDGIVYNKVLRPVLYRLDGEPIADEVCTYYRISELHFADEKAYEDYLQWFRDHPIPPDRGSTGRTAFRFNVITESVEVGR
jgi:hypothetical protein